MIAALASLMIAAPLQERISAMAAQHRGKVALYAKSLESGEVVQIDPDRVVQTASVIKLAIFVEAFHQIKDGKKRLADRVVFKQGDRVIGSGVLQYLRAPLEMTLEDALILMMIESDNTATNLVIDQVGLANVNARIAKLGLRNTWLYKKVYQPAEGPMPADQKIFGLGKSTAREMAALMEGIERCEVGDQKLCARMIEIMKGQQYRNMIPHYLEAETDASEAPSAVADKVGALDAVRADVGAVDTRNGPIVISAFTFDNQDQRWTYENEGELLIARMAKAIVDAWSSGQVAVAGGYPDLLSLFSGWRAFQKPKLVGGVPDYTKEAMAAQARELKDWQRRLFAIDRRGWTVPQQVDFHIVRAEMNGLDFDHRVLRPWEREPDFYLTVFTEETDQPAREGPHALGSIELWRAHFPLEDRAAAELAAALAPIPALLLQARANLTGDARDLWIRGIQSVQEQRKALADLAGKTGPHADLAAATRRALEATDAFIDWLEVQAPSKQGPSGVGIANYDWYLKNVQLVPYTWAEEVLLMERELARARTSLAIEEEKNRALPQQAPIGNAQEHDARFDAAVTEYMKFLSQHDVLTIRNDMDPALRTHLGRYTAARPLEFFTEVDYRDPVLLRTHGYHWFDLARMEHDPNPDPIRRGALLYNIFDTRTEGFATAMEELMMQLGLCDARPRSRELIYILLAQRAARALGDLRMHANQLSLEEAARFASQNTPRGWLRLEGATVWFEQHLFLEQPAYGTSYVIGKLEIDKLLARRLGSGSRLREVMDEKDAAGLIPVSLLRWQMTGDDSGVPGLR